MKIEEIAKRIAELHYPNKPNAIIDEPYRLVRMNTLTQQVETELKNCFIPDVSQQRELLLAFAKHQRDWGNATLTKGMHEKEVEHFLKANNGG